MTTTTYSKLILEREGFRFVEKGIIELNSKPDFRLQMQDEYTKRWHDVYLFDNSMQCSIAMEDIEYAKWLTDQPCYIPRLGPLTWFKSRHSYYAHLALWRKRDPHKICKTGSIPVMSIPKVGA